MQPATIQSALKAAGHYTGELDGIFGPQSRAAADEALMAAGVAFTAWPHSRRMIAIRQWVLKGAGILIGVSLAAGTIGAFLDRILVRLGG